MANDTKTNDISTIDIGDGESVQLNQAYMDRLFCSTKERIGYVLYSAFGSMGIGKYDIGSNLWLYKVFGLEPEPYAKANATLGIYDMINDPLTAAIIDNMRTRWGKFKVFQYLSMLPSIVMGLFMCFMPLIANQMNLDSHGRLIMYMACAYINETIGAFFGGGGYINNVFTPNPNERTSLLVSANFVGDLFKKLPGQIVGVLFDLVMNGKINTTPSKMFVTSKTIVWTMAMIPTIYWYFVSRERVPQSEKPPHPVKGILSVFRNRPLLIYTLTGLIGGIDVGTGEDLYYADVLNFTMLPTIAGIPGSPISYVSYALVPKFRKRFSTKALWMLESGSIVFSEAFFFLIGCIGGKEHGLYLKKIPMTIAFAIGNCVEMVFYATKGIIGTEINYEVLDYCEWKNGYRVEATINLLTGYFTKIKNIILNLVNAKLLQSWAGYQVGENAVQTLDTKWRLFLTACGPHLIFDIIALFPMLFYNIDMKTRERMYLDLEKARAVRAAEEKEKMDTESVSE